MEYNNLYSNFTDLFPECEKEFRQLSEKANADESDGMHVMFSFVVIPFVLRLLSENAENQLKKAFGYFEKMAESGAADVSEVLEFTVIENLMSNGVELFEKSRSYMGIETIKCCDEVRKYLNVGK